MGDSRREIADAPAGDVLLVHVVLLQEIEAMQLRVGLGEGQDRRVAGSNRFDLGVGEFLTADVLGSAGGIVAGERPGPIQDQPEPRAGIQVPDRNPTVVATGRCATTVEGEGEARDGRHQPVEGQESVTRVEPPDEDPARGVEGPRRDRKALVVR